MIACARSQPVSESEMRQRGSGGGQGTYFVPPGIRPRLFSKRLARGGISTHSTEVRGSSVSQQPVSTITGSVIDGTTARHSHPLDRVHPVVFVDAINVKLRGAQATNRRGQHDGTALIDCKTGQLLGLLPGRDAAALAGWLREHPGAEIICRDRAGSGRDGRGGATASAPNSRLVGVPASSMVDLRFQLDG
ncbi:transposase [Streptomyces sp. NPDC056227]|uniref:transposase n=1 Tax=Streptomyces sp. NPDC056227 TaxID=3345753 RepID=UPI0035D80AEE